MHHNLLIPQQTCYFLWKMVGKTVCFHCVYQLVLRSLVFSIYQVGKTGRCGFLLRIILVWGSACKGKKVSGKNQMCYLYVGSFFVCCTNASHTYRYLPIPARISGIKSHPDIHPNFIIKSTIKVIGIRKSGRIIHVLPGLKFLFFTISIICRIPAPIRKKEKGMAVAIQNPSLNQ